MQENITPEAKLLNLIKKGGNNTKDILPQQPKLEESAGEPVPVQKAVTTIPRKIVKKDIRLFSILNKFLFICIICTMIYMVLSYLYSYKSKTEIPERFELKAVEGLVGETPMAPPPVSYYTDILSRRQMFKIYEAPKPKPTEPPKPKVTLGQLIIGYTFIGIVFGDVPQAIIEEKRSGRSFYLSAGQTLGEIKIEKIERGKITISYEDERMEISI